MEDFLLSLGIKSVLAVGFTLIVYFNTFENFSLQKVRVANLNEIQLYLPVFILIILLINFPLIPFSNNQLDVMFYVFGIFNTTLLLGVLYLDPEESNILKKVILGSNLLVIILVDSSFIITNTANIILAYKLNDHNYITTKILKWNYDIPYSKARIIFDKEQIENKEITKNYFNNSIQQSALSYGLGKIIQSIFDFKFFGMGTLIKYFMFVDNNLQLKHDSRLSPELRWLLEDIETFPAKIEHNLNSGLRILLFTIISQGILVWLFNQWLV